jgi:hypothetical protein
VNLVKTSILATSAILALVLVAVVALISNVSPAKAGPTASSVTATVSNPQEEAKTVVYYFHGNMRCSSCRKIEAYTLEAIRSGFAEALKNGSLELKVVNVEESGNDHYVKDFQLYTRSVVVEKRFGDQQQEWKNLDRVWKLTRDKAAFMDYVQKETLAMMNAT